MSFEQILAVASPANGLIIYNTTFKKPVYFDGTDWRFFNDSIMKPKLGDRLFGGVVFDISPNGRNGLVAATEDQSAGATWWNGSYVATGANSNTNGAANTNAIISVQGNTGTYAARICRNYNGGGYTDWFLPSKDQLNLMYVRRGLIGGFDFQGVYWSSTETEVSMASGQYFLTGEQLSSTKNTTDRVRAIRAY
jgi:hypothetical protein